MSRKSKKALTRDRPQNEDLFLRLNSDIISKRYGQLFIEALNSFSIPSLRLFFQSHSTPECMIVHQVYNSFVGEGVPIPNPLGDYTFLQFYSVEIFYDFMDNFYVMVPDVVFVWKHSRTCYERESSVYISAFECSGTILTEASQLVYINQGIISIVRKRMEPTLQHAHQRLSMTGSIALYTDSEGNIYCIEFFYEFE